jgi:hypothetical protein
MFTDDCINHLTQEEYSTHNNLLLALEKKSANQWLLAKIANLIIEEPPLHIKAKNYWKYIGSEVNKKLGFELITPGLWQKHWDEAVELTQNQLKEEKEKEFEAFKKFMKLPIHHIKHK